MHWILTMIIRQEQHKLTSGDAAIGCVTKFVLHENIKTKCFRNFHLILLIIALVSCKTSSIFPTQHKQNGSRHFFIEVQYSSIRPIFILLLLAGFIWNNNFALNEEPRMPKFTEFLSCIQLYNEWRHEKYNGKLQVKVASHTRWNPCLPGARPVIFTFTVVGPAQYCQSSLELEAYVKLQTPHYQSPRHACNSRRCKECPICCKDGSTLTLYTKHLI